MDGSTLLWASYYGGTNWTMAVAITLDADNNVFISGGTRSIDKIATPGAYQTVFQGSEWNGFIAKFNPSGTALIWATYYGDYLTIPTDIVVDRDNNVYIAGDTRSSSGIATPKAYQDVYAGGYFDSFIAKFNPTGTSLLWATYFGGPLTDRCQSMVLDSANNVYIYGYTSSNSDIATPGAYQTVLGGGSDSFIAKFKPDGKSLAWASYYGGEGEENEGSFSHGCKIALDAIGNICIMGSTGSSSGIATPGGYQTVRPGGASIYIAKFNNTGTSLLWGTYYGGLPLAWPGSIALDADDNIYICGATMGDAGNSTPGSYQTVYGGGDWDGLLAKFNSTGTNLLWGSYFGGSHTEAIQSIALDANKNIYIYGWTNSDSGITTAGAYQPIFGGTPETNGFAFVARFSESPFVLNYTVSPVSCDGGSDGAITTNPTGGTSAYTFLWSNGNTNQNVSGLIPGTYTVTVTDAASAVIIYKMVVSNPPALTLSFTSTPDSCLTPTGTANVNALGGNSPYTYFWNTIETTQNISCLSGGKPYTVAVTDHNGCTALGSTVIPSLMKIASSGDISICMGSNTILSVSGGTNYLWSTGGTINNINVQPSGNTTYTVTIQSGSCSKDTSITITVMQPLATVCCNTTIDFGASANPIVATAAANTVKWFPDFGLSCNTCFAPKASPVLTTTYAITIKDNKDCLKTDSITITVNPECGSVFIPDAFSPNNDNNNDAFFIRISPKCVKSFSLTIFERWGQKVFGTVNILQGWDGKFLEQTLEPGIYFYIAKLELVNSTAPLIKKGSISLVR